MQKCMLLLISCTLCLETSFFYGMEGERIKERRREESAQKQDQQRVQPPPVESTQQTIPDQTQESESKAQTTENIPNLKPTKSSDTAIEIKIKNLLYKPESLAFIDPEKISTYFRQNPQDLHLILQPKTLSALTQEQVATLSTILQTASLSDRDVASLLVTIFQTTAALLGGGEQELPKLNLINDALASRLSQASKTPVSPEQATNIQETSQSILSFLEKTFTKATSSIRSHISSLSKAILNSLYYLFVYTPTLQKPPLGITKEILDTTYVQARRNIYNDFYKEAALERTGDFSRPATQAEKKQRARLDELNRAYELTERYLSFT